MRVLTRPNTVAPKELPGLRVVIWDRIAFMRQTSPVKGIASDGTNRRGRCRACPIRPQGSVCRSSGFEAKRPSPGPA